MAIHMLRSLKSYNDQKWGDTKARCFFNEVRWSVYIFGRRYPYMSPSCLIGIIMVSSYLCTPPRYRVSLQLYPSPQYNLSSSITKLYTYSTYIWQSSFQEKISCTIFMLQSKSKYLWLKGVDLTIFSLVLPWLNLRKQAYIIYWMALSINLWPWKMVLPQTFRSIISQY